MQPCSTLRRCHNPIMLNSRKNSQVMDFCTRQTGFIGPLRRCRSLEPCIARAGQKNYASTKRNRINPARCKSLKALRSAVSIGSLTIGLFVGPCPEQTSVQAASAMITLVGPASWGRSTLRQFVWRSQRSASSSPYACPSPECTRELARHKRCLRRLGMAGVHP